MLSIYSFILVFFPHHFPSKDQSFPSTSTSGIPRPDPLLFEGQEVAGGCTQQEDARSKPPQSALRPNNCPSDIRIS